MSVIERFTRLAWVLAMASAMTLAGSGDAGAGPPCSGNCPPAAGAGGSRPYSVLRPIFGPDQTPPRPLYLSGYAGYNYNRAPSGSLVPTSASDSRYFRTFPPHFGIRGR